LEKAKARKKETEGDKMLKRLEEVEPVDPVKKIAYLNEQLYKGQSQTLTTSNPALLKQMEKNNKMIEHKLAAALEGGKKKKKQHDPLWCVKSTVVIEDLADQCPCGNRFVPGAKFCRKCGSQRQTKEEQRVLSTEKKEGIMRTANAYRLEIQQNCQPMAKSCPCGNIFVSDAVCCRKCGRKRPLTDYDAMEALAADLRSIIVIFPDDEEVRHDFTGSQILHDIMEFAMETAGLYDEFDFVFKEDMLDLDLSVVDAGLKSGSTIMAVAQYSHNSVIKPHAAQRLFMSATMAASVDDLDDDIQGQNLQDIKSMVGNHASLLPESVVPTPLIPPAVMPASTEVERMQEKRIQDPATPSSPPRSSVVKGILHARLKRRGVKLPASITK